MCQHLQVNFGNKNYKCITSPETKLSKAKTENQVKYIDQQWGRILTHIFLKKIHSYTVLVLWYGRLRFCLLSCIPHGHQLLAAPIPIQLPVHGLGKPGRMAQVCGPLHLHGRPRGLSWLLAFTLAQLWPLWPCGQWTNRWKVSASLSPLCIAALVLGCVSLLYKEFSNITHLRLYLKFLSFRGNLSFIILLQSFVYFVSIFLSLCFSDLANWSQTSRRKVAYFKLLHSCYASWVSTLALTKCVEFQVTLRGALFQR